MSPEQLRTVEEFLKGKDISYGPIQEAPDDDEVVFFMSDREVEALDRLIKKREASRKAHVVKMFGDVVEPAPKKQTISEEAEEAVNGARQRDYGHPLDNHACTARIWAAWLERRFRLPEGTLPITPEDVCDLNILQKESREANRRTRDTGVDVVGYSRNKEMIGEERDRRLFKEQLGEAE